MQRGLVHALAWSLATGAAVTLSWWGVHTVMAGTAYDPPRAVPISASARDSHSGAGALSSSTRRPPSSAGTDAQQHPSYHSEAVRDPAPATVPHPVEQPFALAPGQALRHGQELPDGRRAGRLRARRRLGEARLGDTGPGLVDAGLDEHDLDPGELHHR